MAPESARSGDVRKQIADASSLVEVVLGEASIKRGPAKHYTPGSVRVSVESGGSFTRSAQSAPSGMIACKDQYSTELLNADGHRIAVINASFVAAFSVDRDVDPDENELEAFANSTGRLVIRPYAREFIQQMSTRMGIPAFMLEVLRFRGAVLEDETKEAGGAPSDVGT